MTDKIRKMTMWCGKRADIVFPMLYIIMRLLYQPRPWGDNTLISAMASWGEPSPYLVYPSYLLGCVIALLRPLMPQLEWFMVMCFAVNLGSVFIWSHYCVKIRGGEPRWSNFVGAAGLIAYISFSLLIPYYSLTCATGVACGLVGMLCAMRDKKWLKFALSIVFLLFAASIRFDGCICLLPVCFALAVWFLLQKQYSSLLSPVVAAAVVCFINVLQAPCCQVSPWEPSAHHPEQNLVLINETRMRFYDYADWHDSEKTQDYAGVGLTENDKGTSNKSPFFSASRACAREKACIPAAFRVK